MTPRLAAPALTISMAAATLAISMAISMAAAGPAAAAQCKAGETKFRANVQYTCICYDTNGQKTCIWQGD